MTRNYLIAAAAAGLFVAGPASADKGDVLVRTRAILVAPTENSGGIAPAFPTEKVKVDNSVMPELDFTYMITKHVGAELILATTKHHVDGRSGTTGSIGRLASTWVLPPTLTLQYHFLPGGAIRPYVGAGVNYTIFYSEKPSQALTAVVGQTGVRLKPSVGYALQAGLDVPVSDRFFLNFDVKYVDMGTIARLHTTAIGQQTVQVDLNPFVFGVGVGTKF